MILLLLAAAAAAQAGPPAPDEQRLAHCIAIAERDPKAGEEEAGRWQVAGGGFMARQCMGLAYSAEQRFASAAGEFEAAARLAETAKDARAATYWAQAGNAWLAGGEPVKANAALNAALSAGTLTGLQRGEAHLDRARASVAVKDLASARAELDLALVDAGDDPLAWLLSATLARRTGDVPRAQKDIAEALRLSADDASVQLEAGNIAAMARDEAGAKAAWTKAALAAPDSPAGQQARAALQQFEAAPVK